MNEQVNLALEVATRLADALQTIIKGREDTVQLLITALLADGHVLLEDYPGSGKTTLTKALGKLIDSELPEEHHILSFRRIQFTPDLLPGDVLGVNVFEPKTSSFRFMHGPIFAHVVLADEINRTGPKVQAAFLECMAEKQVTIDNTTYPLDDLFFVVGTQNPLDLAGTYPLPLVQLDRFLFKIPMNYVDSDVEMQILNDHSQIQISLESLSPVCTRSEILRARKECSSIEIHKSIQQAIVNLVQLTRSNKAFHFGASTRAAIMFQNALKAWAVIQNRTYVTDDDFKTLAPYVLLHRVSTKDTEIQSRSILDGVINEQVEIIIKKTSP